MRVRYNVQGERELQKALEKMGRAVKPSGALGRRVRSAGTRNYKFLRDNIHRDTSAAASAVREKYTETRNSASHIVYFDPATRNPRGRKHRKVIEYIPFEFARGGAHDTWGKMLNQANGFAVDNEMSLLTKEIIG